MKPAVTSEIEANGEVTRRKVLSWLSGFGLFGSLIITAFSNFVFISRAPRTGSRAVFDRQARRFSFRSAALAGRAARLHRARRQQDGRDLHHLHAPGLHRVGVGHRICLPLPRLALRPGRQRDRRSGAQGAALVSR